MPLQIALGREVTKELLPVPLNVVTPPSVPVDAVGVAVRMGAVLKLVGEDISLFVNVIDSEMPVDPALVLFDKLAVIVLESAIVCPDDVASEVVSSIGLVESSPSSELVEPVVLPLLLVLEIALSDAVDCSTPKVELLCLKDVSLLLTVEEKAEVFSDFDMLADKKELLSLSLSEMFGVPV